jgi:hypothetical protein
VTEPARVSIRTNSGRRSVKLCDPPTGTPSRSSSAGNARHKFGSLLAYAGGPIPSAHADPLAEKVVRLDQLEDARDLACLAGPA